jgi:aminopeptidase N
VYYLSGNKANADSGTANLAKYFDFYEKTYGPYSFGAKVGSVEAPWGPGAYGGMEHHPLWHVGSDSMTDNSTHAHEASHGWFGDGVRLLCWEDFVLSEGAADYLAGRAIEAVDGLAAGNAYWAAETSFLDYAVKNYDTIAYPDSCNAIDIFSDPIWSGIPYAKGAFFWKAVETKVGRAALDAALKHFYTTHVGKAAHMQDLIDLVASDTGKSLATEETGWLKSLGHP